MKCFALNIIIISSPHDVMQVARNKLCTKENVCFFPKYPRYLMVSEIYEHHACIGELVRATRQQRAK